MMVRLWNRSHPPTLGVVSVIIALIATISAYLKKSYHGDIGTKEFVNTPCISTFQIFLDDPIEINAANRALSLIRDTYRQDYYNSSISHHHFVQTAPGEIRDALSEFVWNDSTLKQVRSKFQKRSANGRTKPSNKKSKDSSGGQSIQVIPDVFDEIYLMRPEFDLLDQKKVHYDGNLKIPGICTIRALTYLSGKNATLFALTSQQNYTTFNHTSIVLDFDRELHYVSLNGNADNDNHPTIDPDGGQAPRVMVKSALHVVLPGTHPRIAYLRIALHRIMVFAARSFRRAFESKSQPQSDAATSGSNRSMMAIDNLMRSMNKIHMILPLLLIGLPLGAIFLAPVFYPFQFFPYVALIVARCLFLVDPIETLTASCALALAIALLCYLSGAFGTARMKTMPKPKVTKKKSPDVSSPNCVRVDRFFIMVLHVAWVGVCFYVEANADMANRILFAPWQQAINLDDIL